MIDKSNLKSMLLLLGFVESDKSFFTRSYPSSGAVVSVDFKNEAILYPESLKVNKRTTCNFAANENFVVLECVCRLLDKGYRPEHIELEKEWKLGHSMVSGRADICITNEHAQMLCIIECKTYGKEYT